MFTPIPIYSQFYTKTFYTEKLLKSLLLLYEIIFDLYKISKHQTYTIKFFNKETQNIQLFFQLFFQLFYLLLLLLASYEFVLFKN